jgi:hypothetical protein
MCSSMRWNSATSGLTASIRQRPAGLRIILRHAPQQTASLIRSRADVSISFKWQRFQPPEPHAGGFSVGRLVGDLGSNFEQRLLPRERMLGLECRDALIAAKCFDLHQRYQKTICEI